MCVCTCVCACVMGIREGGIRHMRGKSGVGTRKGSRLSLARSRPKGRQACLSMRNTHSKQRRYFHAHARQRTRTYTPLHHGLISSCRTALGHHPAAARQCRTRRRAWACCGAHRQGCGGRVWEERERSDARRVWRACAPRRVCRIAGRHGLLPIAGSSACGGERVWVG